MSATLQAARTINLLAPASGVTHAARFDINLGGATTSVGINWPGLLSKVGNFTPQACRLDNTASTASVLVRETNYGWSRLIEAGVMETWQFEGVDTPEFLFTSSGTVTAVFSLYDWPAMPDRSVNLTNFPGTVVSIAGQPIAVTLTGTLPLPTSITPTVMPVTTVVTGAVAVTALPGGTNPSGGFITNPIAAPGNLFVDIVNTAGTLESATCVELVPGQSFALPGPILTGVSVNSSSAGHVFTGVYW